MGCSGFHLDFSLEQILRGELVSALEFLSIHEHETLTWHWIFESVFAD